ncbi:MULTISPECIES: DUF975 family protein [unclassified Lentimonas]|uniref:DUF975 family protein n=1 Tax=unclassified Lentimonas TaxID=2630993 RepID=UPI001322F0FE|nr:MULTISPECIES: DUF975 family protein [unclassified Lentimonas]CAA6694112.1 Unannotated [Lentimonas sp. CC19]CAA6694389.1 Unannotated [Lentimonas sp. CC10]CAA7070345.1 Unannotated [Lentimonas sp. CC11]
MNWFYEKDGAQQGPISEAELKSLVEAGTLAAHNLVWREGMADWSPYSAVFAGAAPSSAAQVSCPSCGASVSSAELIPAGARQVCPHCRDSYAQGLKEGVSNPVALMSGRGTGGATPNPELRAMAREALSGNWGVSVVVTFLNSLLQQAAAMVPFIGVLIQWAIMGPLSLGFHACFMGLARGEVLEVGNLFSGFSKFWRGVGIYWLVAIFVGLATMLAALPGGLLVGSVFMMDVAVPEEHPLFFIGIAVAAIPAVIVGIYMWLRYALVYFIANDEPETGAFEVLKESTRRMDGHKSKLFSLSVSFIGWHILGFLALFIGMLWSMTYWYAAFAAFYDDLSDEA